MGDEELLAAIKDLAGKIGAMPALHQTCEEDNEALAALGDLLEELVDFAAEQAETLGAKEVEHPKASAAAAARDLEEVGKEVDKTIEYLAETSTLLPLDLFVAAGEDASDSVLLSKAKERGVHADDLSLAAAKADSAVELTRKQHAEVDEHLKAAHAVLEGVRDALSGSFAAATAKLGESDGDAKVRLDTAAAELKELLES